MEVHIFEVPGYIPKLFRGVDYYFPIVWMLEILFPWS